MKTRWNYGQGQVSPCFHNIKQAIAHGHENGAGWLERKEPDTGEWFPCSDAGTFLDLTSKTNADHPCYSPR
jgi:hypothetical protein